MRPPHAARDVTRLAREDGRPLNRGGVISPSGFTARTEQSTRAKASCAASATRTPAGPPLQTVPMTSTSTSAQRVATTSTTAPLSM